MHGLHRSQRSFCTSAWSRSFQSVTTGAHTLFITVALVRHPYGVTGRTRHGQATPIVPPYIGKTNRVRHAKHRNLPAWAEHGTQQSRSATNGYCVRDFERHDPLRSHPPDAVCAYWIPGRLSSRRLMVVWADHEWRHPLRVHPPSKQRISLSPSKLSKR